MRNSTKQSCLVLPLTRPPHPQALTPPPYTHIRTQRRQWRGQTRWRSLQAAVWRRPKPRRSPSLNRSRRMPTRPWYVFASDCVHVYYTCLQRLCLSRVRVFACDKELCLCFVGALLWRKRPLLLSIPNIISASTSAPHCCPSSQPSSQASSACKRWQYLCPAAFPLTVSGS